MKLSDSKKKINRPNKERRNVPSNKLVEVVLVQCNLENNQYQQKSEVFYTSRSKNSYTYLLNVKSSNLVFLKTYDTKFDKIIITFTDQNGRPVEIKDKVNLTFLINRDDALFYETKNKKNTSTNMDFCHLQEIYPTTTEKQLLDTATKTVLDALNTVSKK